PTSGPIPRASTERSSGVVSTSNRPTAATVAMAQPNQYRSWRPVASAAEPVTMSSAVPVEAKVSRPRAAGETRRSEEHTSELQSRFDLVCRLLLEKKNE